MILASYSPADCAIAVKFSDVELTRVFENERIEGLIVQNFGNSLKKSVNNLSALEVKQLLTQLVNSRDTCVRFRLVGEMWMKTFMRVQRVTEKNALVFDEKEQRHYLIPINSLMQFEIDERFQMYQPYFHYNVTPSPELA